MNVIFVEPCFPSYQVQFVNALHQVGANIFGVGEAPKSALPRSVKEKLTHYQQVTNVCDEKAMLEAVRNCQKLAWIDRLEATVEAHILPVAKVREACGIPGTSIKTAFLCRDKPAMKEALRRAGVPCAQSTGASSPAEVRDFAAEVGYPLIIKPPDGAGAAGAERVDNDQQLEGAIKRGRVDQGVTVAVEEFIEGHEGFYDTICIDGQVAHDFASHYYPNVLHAMRTRWISPQVVTTNRIDGGGYEEIKEMGKRVIDVLGIESSATHMEWFYGAKGLKFSEIGCRPPGVGMWDVYCMANEFDIYIEWAMAIVQKRIHKRPSRRYSAGMIALRPDRDGRIIGYEGLDAARAKYGQWIVDEHFPPPGSGTQPVEGGFWANAYMRVKYPDYDGLLAILNDIGERIQVKAR